MIMQQQLVRLSPEYLEMRLIHILDVKHFHKTSISKEKSLCKLNIYNPSISHLPFLRFIYYHSAGSYEKSILCKECLKNYSP